MSFMAKSMYTQINSEAVSKYIRVNCRHTDDVKFVILLLELIDYIFHRSMRFLRSGTNCQNSFVLILSQLLLRLG